MSTLRRNALVALAAMLGIAVAAAITWGTSQLVRQHIGLASEPLSAGQHLLPPAGGRSTPARTSTRPSGTTSTPITTTPASTSTTSTPAPGLTTTSPAGGGSSSKARGDQGDTGSPKGQDD